MDIPLPEESQPPGFLEDLPPPPPPPPGPPPIVLTTPCDNIPLPACTQFPPPGYMPPFPQPARPISAPILPAEAPPLPLLPPPAPIGLESPFDLIDDPNRYSPTRATAEDDLPPTPPPPPPPKSEPPTLGGRSQSTGTKTTVLGKAQAKKRLLAFSMTKQGGGAGLSFGFAKKLAPKVNPGSVKAFSGVGGEEEVVQEGKDNLVTKEKVSSTKKKSNKKGQSREDKARAVVSAIEEIKREELMLRGAIAYGTLGTGDMTLPIPLLGQPLNMPIKPKSEFDVAGNRLLEQQKGAIESLLDTLLSQSDKTSSNDKAASELDADKGDKKDDKKREKKDSDRRSSRRKSSRERHRSRDRHGRSSSGKDRHKEEKKSSKLELPTSWGEFRAGGFKMDEFRRIKLKLEARELSSTNSSRSRDRHRNRRRSPRDRRSRSRERHKSSPSRNGERDYKTEEELDYLYRPFEGPSRLRFPMVITNSKQKVVEYPRGLIRYTKSRPPVCYCERPDSERGHYRTKAEVLADATPEIVQNMLDIINSRPLEEPLRVKHEAGEKVSSSLAALKVSYDEAEVDGSPYSFENVSDGRRRDRPWFPEKDYMLPTEPLVKSGETDLEKESAVKKEKEESEKEHESANEQRESLDSPETHKSDHHVSDREEDLEVISDKSPDTVVNFSKTTVRSKWDSDYEEEDMMSTEEAQQNVTAEEEEEEELEVRVEQEEEEEEEVEEVEEEQVEEHLDQQNEVREKIREEEQESLPSIDVEVKENSFELSVEDGTSDSTKINRESNRSLEFQSEDILEVDEEKESKANKDENDKEEDDKEEKLEVSPPNENENVEKVAADSGNEEVAQTVETDQEKEELDVESAMDISTEGNTDMKLVSEYEEFMKAVCFNADTDADADEDAHDVSFEQNLSEVEEPQQVSKEYEHEEQEEEEEEAAAEQQRQQEQEHDEGETTFSRTGTEVQENNTWEEDSRERIENTNDEVLNESIGTVKGEEDEQEWKDDEDEEEVEIRNKEQEEEREIEERQMSTKIMRTRSLSVSSIEEEEPKPKKHEKRKRNNKVDRKKKKKKTYFSDDSSSSDESSSSSSEDARHKRKKKTSKKEKHKRKADDSNEGQNDEVPEKSKSKKVSKKKKKKTKKKKSHKRSSKRKKVESSSSSSSTSSEDDSSEEDSSSSESDKATRHRKNKESKPRKVETDSSSDDDSSSSSSLSSSSSSSSSVQEKKKKRKKKVTKKKKDSHKKKKERSKKKKKRKSHHRDSSYSDKEKGRNKYSRKDSHKISGYNKKTESKEFDKESNERGRNKERNGHQILADILGNVSSTDTDHKAEHKQKFILGTKSTDFGEGSRRKDKKLKGKNDLAAIREVHPEMNSSDENYWALSQRSHSRITSELQEINSHANLSDDERRSETEKRKSSKKRRREQRSRSTSPSYSLGRKRRRSPSTSPEHSPTPQRRGSTESKDKKRKESRSSHDQADGDRHFKHSDQDGRKRGHSREEYMDSGSQEQILSKNKNADYSGSENQTEESSDSSGDHSSKSQHRENISTRRSRTSLKKDLIDMSVFSLKGMDEGKVHSPYHEEAIDDKEDEQRSIKTEDASSEEDGEASSGFDIDKSMSDVQRSILDNMKQEAVSEEDEVKEDESHTSDPEQQLNADENDSNQHAQNEENNESNLEKHEISDKDEDIQANIDDEVASDDVYSPADTIKSDNEMSPIANDHFMDSPNQNLGMGLNLVEGYQSDMSIDSPSSPPENLEDSTFAQGLNDKGDDSSFLKCNTKAVDEQNNIVDQAGTSQQESLLVLDHIPLPPASVLLLANALKKQNSVTEEETKNIQHEESSPSIADPATNISGSLESINHHKSATDSPSPKPRLENTSNSVEKVQSFGIFDIPISPEHIQTQSDTEQPLCEKKEVAVKEEVTEVKSIYPDDGHADQSSNEVSKGGEKVEIKVPWKSFGYQSENSNFNLYDDILDSNLTEQQVSSTTAKAEAIQVLSSMNISGEAVPKERIRKRPSRWGMTIVPEKPPQPQNQQDDAVTSQDKSGVQDHGQTAENQGAAEGEQASHSLMTQVPVKSIESDNQEECFEPICSREKAYTVGEKCDNLVSSHSSEAPLGKDDNVVMDSDKATTKQGSVLERQKEIKDEHRSVGHKNKDAKDSKETVTDLGREETREINYDYRNKSMEESLEYKKSYSRPHDSSREVGTVEVTSAYNKKVHKDILDCAKIPQTSEKYSSDHSGKIIDGQMIRKLSDAHDQSRSSMKQKFDEMGSENQKHSVGHVDHRSSWQPEQVSVDAQSSTKHGSSRGDNEHHTASKVSETSWETRVVRRRSSHSKSPSPFRGWDDNEIKKVKDNYNQHTGENRFNLEQTNDQDTGKYEEEKRKMDSSRERELVRESRDRVEDSRERVHDKRERLMEGRDRSSGSRERQIDSRSRRDDRMEDDRDRRYESRESQDRHESSRDRRDSNRDHQDVHRDRRDGGRDKRDISQDSRLSSRDRDAFSDRRSDRRDENRDIRDERDRRDDRRGRDRWDSDRNRERDRDRRSERDRRESSHWDKDRRERDRRRDERRREDRDRDRESERSRRRKSHSRSRSRSPRTSTEMHKEGTSVEQNHYVRNIPLPGSGGGNDSWRPKASVTGSGETDVELSCSPASSPLVGFKRSLADSTISDSELVSIKQEEPSNQYHRGGYYEPEHYTPSVYGNQAEVSPTISPTFSPKRLSLDDRIELELGVKKEAPPLPPLPQQLPQQIPVYHQQQSYPTAPASTAYPSYQGGNYYPVPPPHSHYEKATPGQQNYMQPPPEEFHPHHKPFHPAPPLDEKMGPTPAKRRPPLLPTPNIAPNMSNWDSPEAFIGTQEAHKIIGGPLHGETQPVVSSAMFMSSQHESLKAETYGHKAVTSSQVVQVGNVLQVVPADLPTAPPPPPPAKPPQKSMVLQAGNMLQVIPSESLPTVAPPHCITTAGSSSNSQVLQVGNVLQVVPSPSPTPQSPHGPVKYHQHQVVAPPPPGKMMVPPPGKPAAAAAAANPPMVGVLGIGTTPEMPAHMGLSPTVANIQSPVSKVQQSPRQQPMSVLVGTPLPPMSSQQISPSLAAGAGVVAPGKTMLPVPVPNYSPPASPFLSAETAQHMQNVISEIITLQAKLFSETATVSYLPPPDVEAERRREEKEQRRQEKERRRQEKEKRRQMKMKMAADNIIKKALQHEGDQSDIDLEEMRLIEEAMLEVPEEEPLIEGASAGTRKKKKRPPIQVKPLPPAGKGILISPGFRDKPLVTELEERKSVKFADGVRPGEGTSPSAGEDLPSPPPPPRKLPKEKRFKKKKKKKIKVKIIRQINVEDDDDDEDISPPPPPPGSPPPPPLYPGYTAAYPQGYVYQQTPTYTVVPAPPEAATSAPVNVPPAGAATVYTPIYHQQHHHTSTSAASTSVQFAAPPPPPPPPPPAATVPPSAPSPLVYPPPPPPPPASSPSSGIKPHKMK